MSYMAMYRKFRPTVFSEVKGQDAIVTTLKNQIKSERIGHAYLFCGTRGTGKTTVAKILAKAVNCDNPVDGEPCGECPVCKGIAAGTLLNVVEIDAASNSSVDNVRQIVDEVSYSPTEGKYKVYILDEVHMLTPAAFNALLKTLEEPPSYVIFILATTESHKIPITILSRCQRYDFKRISLETIADRMRELTEKEGAEVDEDALTFIAKEADGSMRDALSLLDQCLAFHFGERLTYEKALEVLGAVDDGIFAEIVQYISAGDSLNALKVVDEVSVQGRDFTQFVGNLLWYLRNLMLVKSSDVSPQSLEISTESLERLKEIAAKLELTTIMRYIRILSDLNADMKYSDQKRILLEIAVIRMCKPQMEEDVDSLIDRIRDLEKKSKGAQFIPLEMMGTMQGNPAGAVNLAKPKPVREKALPEDVQKVLGSWESIRETLEPLLANMLTNCRLSINDEDVLLVVPTEKLSEEYLKKEGAMDSLREAVAERVGKEVKMELKPLVNDDDFTDNYVDVVRMFGKLVVKDDTI